jgi:hypothetical protein
MPIKTVEEIEAEYEKKFKDWKIHHKTTPCIKDDFVINEIKAFFLSHYSELVEGAMPKEKELWRPKPFPKGKEGVLGSETAQIAYKNAIEMKDNREEWGYNQALQQTREAFKKAGIITNH